LRRLHCGGGGAQGAECIVGDGVRQHGGGYC
jgi:hypothetical protein